MMGSGETREPARSLFPPREDQGEVSSLKPEEGLGRT